MVEITIHIMPRSALLSVVSRNGVKKKKEYYEGKDLYVFRFKQDQAGEWTLGSSKPCIHCMELIKKAKIKVIDKSPKKKYFSTIFGGICI